MVTDTAVVLLGDDEELHLGMIYPQLQSTSYLQRMVCVANVANVANVAEEIAELDAGD